MNYYGLLILAHKRNLHISGSIIDFNVKDKITKLLGGNLFNDVGVGKDILNRMQKGTNHERKD